MQSTDVISLLNGVRGQSLDTSYENTRKNGDQMDNAVAQERRHQSILSTFEEVMSKYRFCYKSNVKGMRTAWAHESLAAQGQQVDRVLEVLR